MNFLGTERTNYFRVTDEERYEELFSRLCGESTIEDFSKKDKDGNILHAFGASSSIDYRASEDDWDMDIFYEEIQKILPDGEAFIHVGAGHEGLRYLSAWAYVVTNNDTKFFDAQGMALSWAKEQTGNEDILAAEY